ncbi:hypothetical protein BKA70DRAFT_1117269 [Coprinopsis sp. MPI-PUGE-AT-0042]|nr:hypothetical protein BKA70DRAFT_1117269 [Coprinopsis sp. MPI-PUGE-AT-0042]
MPVIEIAIVRFSKPYAADPLPKILRAAQAGESAWAGYPVIYYADPERDDTIYLVSGWKDVAAHEAWIVSDENQDLSAQIEPFVVELSIRHLEIDPAAIPMDSGILVWRTLPEGEEPTSSSGVPGGSEEIIWEGRGGEVERPTVNHHIIGYSPARSTAEVLGAWKSREGEWKAMARVDL